MAEFTTLNTEQVEAARQKGVEIIDIRRPDEWQKFGVIEGSHKMTFFDGQGKYDINKWLADFRKVVTRKNQPFILVCAHANRTKTVGRFLDKQAGYQNVQELGGGIIDGWIKKGLKTTKISAAKKSWWQLW